MRKQTVYFLKGLPASGKSTWAREKIEEDRMNGIVTKRVNKDDLRAMLDNSNYSKEREKFVLEIRDEIVYEALRQGYDVIVDDTNFLPKHKERIEGIVQSIVQSAEFDNNVVMNIEVEEIFFDVSLSECIERDKKRENPVGEKVIRNMYNQHLRKENETKVEYNPNLPDCIIVDVDGTLAIRGDRSPYDYWMAGIDKLNKPIADLLFLLEHHSHRVINIIMTGRENVCDEDGYTVSDLTQKWLKDNNINFDEFYIRKNNDHRPDFEVKKEMYENFIKDNYNVLYVIDDRKQVVDMWRKQGLTVLDVAGHDF
jgi:predicted kinase